MLLGSGNGFDANGNQTATASGPSMIYNKRNQTSSITLGTTKSLGVLSERMNELSSEGNLMYHYGLMGLAWRYDAPNVDKTFYTRTPDGEVVGLRRYWTAAANSWATNADCWGGSSRQRWCP